ncbi:MAG: type IV toxin-antitoxin system AbiEi family antitoxin domain-containing protein [Coxiellaceae bacterium]|nr:MAG: type IV toxin-antitoxin system AbiEi family antitoxin domain-containing protein [Coxiellaceae bacterium]
MSRLKNNKIKQLLSKWPYGVVLTSYWLTKHGYYKQLIKKYCDSGWIRKVGQGAYLKIGEQLQWPGAVYALQKELNLPMHVGSITALELHGLAQNVAFNETKSPFYLFNTTAHKKPLPKWFSEAFPECIYIQRHLFKRNENLESRKVDNVTIDIASPEQAILELLALVPQKFDYAHAHDLVENLRLLRPQITRTLLQQCLSIKVKRLFLYLAEKHHLPCFTHLNIKSLDLGKGKRKIGQGGHYIAKYQISVPILREKEEEGIGHV